jgi:hypothetical protein
MSVFDGGRLTYAGILKKSTKFLLNPCIAATVNFSGASA